MSGVPGKAAEKTGWTSRWNCAQEGCGGSEGSQNYLPEALRATQGAGCGADLPPAVCGACLELVQGAEAEVRLLRQGRLPLLDAARGPGDAPWKAHLQVSLVRGSRGYRGAYSILPPPPGVRERPQRPALPTYHAGAVDPRARCSPQLSLEPFFSQALWARARARSAGRGRTGRHSSAGPRDGGKTRPDSLARREPQRPARPPDVGGGNGTAPKRPEPRPGSRVLRGRVATARCARCSGHPGARSLAHSLACSSSADPGPDEALERAPAGCSSSSSSSSGPRPPHPVSFQNQLPNWLAGMGRSGLRRLFFR